MHALVDCLDPGLTQHVLRTPDLTGGGDEDDGAFVAGTCGTTRAVQVVLGIARRIDLQDEVDVVDVDAACSDIGCDEEVDLAFLEVGDRFCAGSLGLAAVQRLDADAEIGEFIRPLLDPKLCPCEADSAAVAFGDVVHDLRLFARVHDEQVMGHRRHRSGLRISGMLHRVTQVRLHELVDAAVERRREQQPLPIRCDEIHEFLDLVHEAHVGHLVGFVEHGDRNFGEIHRTLVHQIDEPTRRGDNDVCASLEALDLPLVRRATDDELHRQLRLMCERCQCIAHLHGEFTGWHEHHGPRELRA